MGKKLKDNTKKRFMIEQLETRLLLSSDLVFIPFDGSLPPQDAADSPSVVESGPLSGTVELFDAAGQERLRHEIVFVDAGVKDYQKLVDDLRARGDDGRRIEVLVLDGNRDGIEQISETLAWYKNLDAVHVVSHGTDGALQLGNAMLNLASLDHYAGSIEGWRNALGSEADLLLYGCDLAAGKEGRALIESLTYLTGADVAASDDPTGNARLGGDWNLEFHDGHIETKSAFSIEIQQNWSGLLAEVTISDDFSSNSYSGGTGWAGNWQEIGEADGAGDGNVKVVSNALQITTDDKPDSLRGISRAADLSSATSAYLSFTYNTQKIDDGGQVQLQIKAAGSSTWDTLASYKITASTTGNYVFIDVSSYISSNTEIRFVSMGMNFAGGTSDGVDTFIADNIKIQYTTTSWTSGLWVTTDGDVNAGGQPGVDTWKKGDIIQFADPNLAFEPGTTNGTFSMVANWSPLKTFSDGHNINALHYVSTNIKIGSSNFQLYEGDLLFASKDASADAFGGLNVDKDDIVLFRPNTPGDYSSGTFTILLRDLVPGQEIRGISLIEKDVVVGGKQLYAGDFLFLRQGGTEEKQVWLYETNDVEPGTGTSGTASVLLKGADTGIDISQRLVDVDIVETTTTIGGRTLNAGTILLAVNGGDTVGTLAVTEWDIFALDVTTVSDPVLPNVGNATASLFFQGDPDLNFSSASKIDGFTLTVSNNTNTAPILTPSSPNLTTITENSTNNTGDLVSVILGSSVSDTDGDSIGIAITGSTNGNGTWQYSTNSGSIWTSLGSVSNTNALLLRGTDLIRFVPDGMNADSATITYCAWDQSDNGTAGTKADTSTNGGTSAFSANTDTASITVTTVNDAPSGTNKTVTILEDASYTFSASDFGFTDAEDSPVNALLAVKITSVPLSGTLKNNGVTVNAGDTISVTDINLNRLVFTPAADANGTAYASFTFQVQDDGGTVSGGIDLDPTPNTVTIDVTPVNDAPVITAPGGPITYTTLDPATVLDPLATVSDIDSSDLNGGTLTISISVGGTADDELRIVTGGNVTLNGFNVEVSGVTIGSYSGGTSGTDLVITWNSNSNPANIQEVLQRISYRNISSTQDTSTRIIEFVLTDGDGGNSNIIHKQVNFFCANRASVVTMPSPPAAYTENATPVLIDSAATVSDVDSLDLDTGTLTVSITANGSVNDNLIIMPGGNVTLTGFNIEVSGITVGSYSGGTSGADLIITLNANSTTAAIQEVLRKIAFSNSSENPSTAMRTIEVTLTDGDGGTSTAVEQFINVVAVNDAPAGTDKTISTFEDIPYTFSTADFGFSDTAEGHALLAVKIATVPLAGTLTCNGIASNAGDIITAVDIAAGKLDYTPAANENGTGFASFTFQVQDSGGTASGGADLDPTPNTITIDVASVNDAPVIIGAFAGQTGNDNVTIAPFAGVTISDVDNPAQTLSVSVALDDPAKGTFTTLNGFTETLAGSGIYTFTGTAAAASSAIQGLVFDPADNRVAPGNTETTTFTISIDDGIAPAVSDNNTIVISTSVNDAPTAAADTITTNEDTSVIIISATDLLGNDTDFDGDTLSITGFTQGGNGTVVDNGDGTLTYTPSGNFNGRDNFTYIISDGKGAADIGIVIIDVTPVGDTPQAANISTLPNTHTGLIVLDRNSNDGAEVTHFRISNITNGTLYLADGVTQINNGAYITLEQAQAGLRFRPSSNSIDNGSFAVESSENGHSVAVQSGVAISLITVIIPAPTAPEAGMSGQETNTAGADQNISEVVLEAPGNISVINIPVHTNAPAPMPRIDTGKVIQNSDHKALTTDDFLKDSRKTGDQNHLPSVRHYFDNLENLGIHFVENVLKTLLPGQGQSVAFERTVAKAYEHLRDSLDSLKKETAKDIMFSKATVGSAAVVSASLSAGYVVWLIRGGMLLSSVLSSLPAWQFVDPLPVLAQRRDDFDSEDEETLESIAKSGSRDDDRNETKHDVS